jgi:SAM-dependent methyltransferase
LTVAPDGMSRCAHCAVTYPAHVTRKCPIILSQNSTLKAAEIVNAPIFPQQGDARAAQDHWATGDLVGLLASCPGKSLLSYGSGDGGDYHWLKNKGYEVTTFDVYPSDFTDYICDGHDLCFADAQFDIVTSLAVFEHLYNPFMAGKEIHRVLKPGGFLVGSVAFLEPFHANSYFHMSHLGISEVLKKAGFKNITLHPGWSGIEALSNNFWPLNKIAPIRKLNGALHRLLHRFGLWQWRLSYKLRGKEPPPYLDLMFCGSIVFKAQK